MFKKSLALYGLATLGMVAVPDVAYAHWPFGPVYKQRTVIRPGHHGGFPVSSLPVLTNTAPRGAVLGAESAFADPLVYRRESAFSYGLPLTGLTGGRESSFRLVPVVDGFGGGGVGGAEANLGGLGQFRGGTGGSPPMVTPPVVAPTAPTCCDELKAKVKAVEDKVDKLDTAVKELDRKVTLYADTQRQAAAAAESHAVEQRLIQLIGGEVDKKVGPLAVKLNEVILQGNTRATSADAQNKVLVKLVEVLGTKEGSPERVKGVDDLKGLVKPLEK